MKQKIKKVKRGKKGRFVVIEGVDGCGKKTQTELLIKKLRKEGRRIKTIDFPQYYNNFFGKLIGECLAGEHGDFAQLDPKIASALYAADRFESSKKIQKWLDAGNVVIADRYANSNQTHQGGKITDARRRREFLQWLEKMEFEIFQIAKPDAIIYLNLPLKFSLQLLANKDNKKKKAYLNGKKDAHESDPKHLMNAKRSALNLVKENNNWIDIQCVRNDTLLSRENISNLIWEEIKDVIK